MESKALTIKEMKDAKLKMENYIGYQTSVAIQAFHKTTGLYPSSINIDLRPIYQLGLEKAIRIVEGISSEIDM